MGLNERDGRKTINWQRDTHLLEFIRGLYIAGQSTAEMLDGLQKAHGITLKEKALESIIHRYCREEIEARKAVINETRKLRSKVRELAAQGHADAEIADKCEISSDQVQGMIERKGGRATFDFGKWLARQEYSEVPEDPIVDGGLLITELGTSECRWPIGKDTDGLFRFCGCQFDRSARNRVLGPYCDAHAPLTLKTPHRAPRPVKIREDLTDQGPVMVRDGAKLLPIDYEDDHRIPMAA